MKPQRSLGPHYFLQQANTVQQSKAHLGATIFLNLNRILLLNRIINALACISNLSSKDLKRFNKQPQKSPPT